MKNIHRLGLLAAGLLATAAASAADVGVSVSVNQPGFYGRVDINQPPPPSALIFAQPLIIQQPAVTVRQQPIYLHVPPGHAKNWGKHCGKYNACGQPVYFVQDTYYERHYAAQYEGRRDNDHPGQGHGHGGKDKGGHGGGKGHGKGGKHD
jgi:hypothetical protein